MGTEALFQIFLVSERYSTSWRRVPMQFTDSLCGSDLPLLLCFSVQKKRMVMLLRVIRTPSKSKTWQLQDPLAR